MPVAFPGAEGFGANATGGRGGTVYRVTNLNNSGAGSLRAALEASGTRIIVFDIGGTITLTSGIVVTNPNYSVFGQTAPPDSGGITLKNGGALTQAPLRLKAGNGIIQYIRIRTGASTAQTSALDSLTIGNSSANVENIIIDHCSFSWSVDENLNPWYATRNVTFSNCIIAEGLHDANHSDGHAHSRGCSAGNASGGRFSFIRNLWTHNVERNPIIVTGLNWPVEVINNVVYAYGWPVMIRGNYGGAPRVNVIGNFFKPGSNTSVNRYEVEPQSTTTGSGDPRIYVRGNIGQKRTSDAMPENACVNPTYHSWLVTTPFAGSGNVAETTAQQAWTDVLAGAGCRVPLLDSVDERIISQAIAGTGSIVDDPSEVGGWPTLAAGTAWVDTDGDGMPDAYELIHGLNPSNASDGATLAPDGYSNLEKFAHFLAAGGSVDEDPPGSESSLIDVERLMTFTAETGSPIDTDSWSPDAEKLLLVAIESRRTSASGTYDLTGNGLTWTKIADIRSQDGTTERQRLSVWKAWSGSSPTAGALTLTYTSNTSAVVITALQLGNVDVTDQVEAVTTFDSTGTASTNLQLAVTPLTPFAMVLGFAGYRGVTTFTVPTGQTAVSNASGTNSGGSGGERVNLTIMRIDGATPNVAATVGGAGVLSSSTQGVMVALSIAPDIEEGEMFVPAAPADLVATTLTDTSVGLAWTDMSDGQAHGFSIERSADGTTGWTEIDTTTTETTYTDTGLTPNTEYFYRVRATTDVTASDPSNVASATTFATLLSANFSATPLSGLSPLTVAFTNLSEAVGGAVITDVLWTFGDGNTSTEFNPEPHVYTTAGTFTVSLEVDGEDSEENPLTDTETKSNLIIVSAPVGTPVLASAAVPVVPLSDVRVSAKVG